MANMSRLSNKVAIVTGASKGIGSGIAIALGAAGVRVAVNYSTDREGAERVAQAITDNRGEAITVGPMCPGPQMPRGYSKKWILHSED
jgi:3-oxoacyl-[acyl-carrier protein] reductase